MTAKILTHARLKELLHYEPETGVFVRMTHRNRLKPIGSTWGTLNKSLGYLNGGLEGAQFTAHRLAWFYTHGVWPSGEIDHINGNRADNRIENLRSVSHRTNQQNRRGATSASLTGILGVKRTPSGRFAARIRLQSGELHIGTFNTPEAAQEAHLAAKRKHHPGNTL